MGKGGSDLSSLVLVEFYILQYIFNLTATSCIYFHLVTAQEGLVLATEVNEPVTILATSLRTQRAIQ